MTPSEEPVYRRCYECGTEWTAEALVAAHNVILDNCDPGHLCVRVTGPADIYWCPECIHDW